MTSIESKSSFVSAPLTGSKAMSLPLFVVSQIGQIKHAEALCKHLNIYAAELAIIWTAANGKMPTIISETASTSIFSIHRFIEIDPQSNSFSVPIAMENQRIYGDLLDDARPTSLFVCSNERHYSLLIRQANERSIPVHLFEEGAGSFKGLQPDYIPFAPPSFADEIASIYRRIWKETAFFKHIIVPIYRLVRDIAKLPVLIAKTIVDLRNAPSSQVKIINKRFPSFAHGTKKFVNIYSSDPDLMRNIFEADNFIEVRASYDDVALIFKTNEIVKKYGIDENTAIYAAQHFVLDTDILNSAIVKALNRISEKTGWRILIKIHPKEPPSSAIRFSEAISKSRNIDVIMGDCPPAEYLALHSECQAVISISSSTLLYAPQHKPGLRSITIGDEVLQSVGTVKQSGVLMISENMKIMRAIHYIENSLDID